MKSLELKIPPALLMLICTLVMWAIDRLLPAFKQNWDWHEWAAKGVFLVAVSCIVLGVISFKLAKTTVDPTQPNKATSVVTTGIYRLTRNPMYLGFLLVLLAFFFKLANPITLLMLPAFVWYMKRFQIMPEERALSELFGTEYENYLTQVRRWV